MPEDIRDLAELNDALPIGYGQTISQPLTVALMLELLQPEPGNRILDIGSGSGWTTGLLSFIVSRLSKVDGFTYQAGAGKVIAIEIIPELKEFGEKNAAKYSFIEKGIAKFLCMDGTRGYKPGAPYDRILVSASADAVPEEWRKQLKIGGRIVCPIKSSIWLIEKRSEEEFEDTEYSGFAFVPLISEE